MLQLMVIYQCYINPFEANFPLTEKPGGWFLPVETVKNSCLGVTFLLKMLVVLLKISFFPRSFPHIFAVATQLPCSSIGGLPNAEDFLNVNIFFKRKC